MPKILVPGFELFGGLTDTLTNLDKGISETMRVEIRQTSIDKGLAEYSTNGRGIAPKFPGQPCHFKLTGNPQRNARRREDWIIIAL
jgi:hypothetical protein